MIFDRVAASRRHGGDIAPFWMMMTRPSGNTARSVGVLRPFWKDLGLEHGRGIRRQRDCAPAGEAVTARPRAKRPEAEWTWEGRQAPVSHGNLVGSVKDPVEAARMRPLERD